MATNHYKGQDSTESKPTLTPTEAYLTERHGDLHTVIPPLVNSESIAAAALILTDDKVSVTPIWISRWLHRHGYVRAWYKGGAS